MNATVIGTVFTLLPMKQIILDKSDCPTVLPTTTTPTMPTGQVITEDTCSALREIAELSLVASLGGSCQVSSDCDAVSCDIAGFGFYTQLLPCNMPPSILFQISDSNGVIFERVLNDSSTFINLENIGSAEFLIEQIESGIIIQVTPISHSLLEME